MKPFDKWEYAPMGNVKKKPYIAMTHVVSIAFRRTFAPQSDDKVWLRGFSVYGKPVPFPGTEFSGWSQPQRL